MDKLYSELAEILEVADINPDDKLTGYGTWDSLSILSIITLLDTTYGIRVNASELKAFETVREIEDFVRKRRIGD
jgi:acyl carrier protein